jgi:hypothetical protein
MSSTALRSSYLRSVLRPLVFISLAFLFALPLLADSHVRIVRLSYVDGDVQLDKADGRGFGTAYLNMPIVNQSKLWARDGQAEVELEDGSSIRLTPDTIVAFNELSLDNNGGRNTSVELQQGTAYFDIRHRDSDHFQLDFGRNHVSLDKSARFRVNVDKHDFEVAVLSGEIDVENASNAEVAVKKGETIRLDSDDPDRYYLAKGVDAENYDDWDNERVKWHDEAVASNSYQNGNGSYGISDLSMYGNYFYVPGYGYMWRPYSVGLGWDPFADGYWISYPGFGYTFVSGYPWGWAPYRYGSWQFINGYGWCWHPGSNWNNWQTVPPVYNIPPHYRPPMPPHHHGSPVMVVDNGRVLPVPHRHMVVDNDAIEHHRPVATKITTAGGEVVQQGSAPPAQGFVGRPGFTSNAPATGVTIAPIPRLTGPRLNGPRWAEGERVPREVQSPRAQPPAMGVVSPRPTPSPLPAAAPPQAMPAAPVRMAPPAHNDRPMPSPRMEPRSSPAPMHMGGMSAGASMPHPSMSSGGGMRMSAPSMGGGGGMHGGGGGGAGSSHGSHR